MRILFDQGTPLGIRKSLPTQVVKTAYELGWSTLLNGDLLRKAEEAQFDVFVSTDKNLVYQQNLRNRTIAIVVLGQTRWNFIKLKIDEIVRRIEGAEPGSYTFIEIPARSSP